MMYGILPFVQKEEKLYIYVCISTHMYSICLYIHRKLWKVTQETNNNDYLYFW